jgi:hypothetical protein
MSTITKHIKLQISGDADAVNAAISLLHHLNFIKAIRGNFTLSVFDATTCRTSQAITKTTRHIN